jgi:hypothetical protein
MVEDFPCGKVLIDVGRRYITVYRCDGNGFVQDEERFKLPWMINRLDAVDLTHAAFNLAYSWADGSVSPPAASDGDKPADSGKRRPKP